MFEDIDNEFCEAGEAAGTWRPEPRGWNNVFFEYAEDEVLHFYVDSSDNEIQTVFCIVKHAAPVRADRQWKARHSIRVPWPYQRARARKPDRQWHQPIQANAPPYSRSVLSA